MNLLPVFSTPTPAPAPNASSAQPAEGAAPQGFQALLQGLAAKSPSGASKGPGAEASTGEASPEAAPEDEAAEPTAWAPTVSVAQMLLQVGPASLPAGTAPPSGTPVPSGEASEAGPAELAAGGAPMPRTPVLAADVALSVAGGAPEGGSGGAFQQALAGEGLAVPGNAGPAPAEARPAPTGNQPAATGNQPAPTGNQPAPAPRTARSAPEASSQAPEAAGEAGSEPASGTGGKGSQEPSASLEPPLSGFALAGESGSSAFGEAGTGTPDFAASRPQEGETPSAQAELQGSEPNRSEFSSLVEKTAVQRSDSPETRIGSDQARDFTAPAPVASAPKPDAPATPVAPATPSTDPIPTTTVARAVPAERVAETARAWARQAISGVRTRPRSLEIQLDPPRLGRIRIEVSADESGAIKAVVQVENRQAQGLLEQQTSQLQQRLAEAGVHLQEFSLGGFGSQADHSGRGPSQSPFAGPASSDESNLPQEAPAAVRTGLLNLRV